MSVPKTLFEKVWESHLVAEPPDEPAILYIDLHLVHEVTSPQAFEGLRMAGRQLRRGLDGLTDQGVRQPGRSMVGRHGSRREHSRQQEVATCRSGLAREASVDIA